MRDKITFSFEPEIWHKKLKNLYGFCYKYHYDCGGIEIHLPVFQDGKEFLNELINLYAHISNFKYMIPVAKNLGFHIHLSGKHNKTLEKFLDHYGHVYDNLILIAPIIQFITANDYNSAYKIKSKRAYFGRWCELNKNYEPKIRTGCGHGYYAVVVNTKGDKPITFEIRSVDACLLPYIYSAVGLAVSTFVKSLEDKELFNKITEYLHKKYDRELEYLYVLLKDSLKVDNKKAENEMIKYIKFIIKTIGKDTFQVKNFDLGYSFIDKLINREVKFCWEYTKDLDNSITTLNKIHKELLACLKAIKIENINDVLFIRDQNHISENDVFESLRQIKNKK